MKAKYRRIVSAFALVLLSLVKSLDGAALTVKVGYPQLSGSSMPLWVITETTLMATTLMGSLMGSGGH